jgi:hypothetical protein
MHEKKSIMETKRAAYLLGTPFGGHIPEYEDVQAAARDFIRANYEYQKAAYGRVRVRLSVANVLR